MSTGALICAAVTIAAALFVAANLRAASTRVREVEHEGATLTGPTPGAEVRAHRELNDDDLRRERALGDEERRLADAGAAVAPLLAQLDDSLWDALSDFRAVVARAQRRAERWHAGAPHCCRTCTAVHHVPFLPTRGQLAEALLSS